MITTSENTGQFLCKYCCDAMVTHYGGVCPSCEQIAYKVRAEERRYWANQVSQELNQIIRRMN